MLFLQLNLSSHSATHAYRKKRAGSHLCVCVCVCDKILLCFHKLLLFSKPFKNTNINTYAKWLLPSPSIPSTAWLPTCLPHTSGAVGATNNNTFTIHSPSTTTTPASVLSGIPCQLLSFYLCRSADFVLPLYHQPTANMWKRLEWKKYISCSFMIITCEICNFLISLISTENTNDEIAYRPSSETKAQACLRCWRQSLPQKSTNSHQLRKFISFFSLIFSNKFLLFGVIGCHLRCCCCCWCRMWHLARWMWSFKLSPLLCLRFVTWVNFSSCN